MSFIFGGNTGTTYEDLQRKRKLAEQLAQGAIGRAPGSIGEGLSAIGKALAYRSLARKGDALEGKLNTEADSIWSGLFNTPSQVSQPQPFNAADIPQVNMDQGDPRRGAFPTGSSETAPEYTPGDRDSFVAAMMPHALKVSQQTGIDPRVVIAQAALETGYGKSAPGNNYFGIKSHGKAGGNTLATTEVIDGKPVQVRDSFRAYGGMGDSAMGYAEFLQENPRYKAMLSADGLDAQIEALGASGYATDPNYAAKVRQIATSIGLPEGAMPQSGPGLEKIVAAMGNPMIRKDPAKMALLQALMGQQLQAADPMRALELERAQLEIENLRNPTPKATDDMREYQAAREQGFEGTFMDYQTAVRKAGAPNVRTEIRTGNEQGRYLYGAEAGLPTGWRIDTTTGEASPIPGGPAAVEAQALAEKSARKDEQAGVKLGTTLSSINLNIAEIENAGLPVTGPIGDARRTWLGRAITGNDAFDFGNRSSQITDSAALAEIQNMRDNSPTGGAVGSLTDKEREAIGNAVTAINASTSADEYIRAAKAYRELALDLAYGAGNWQLGEDGQTVIPGAGGQSPLTGDDYQNLSDEELLQRLRAQ